MISPCDHVAQGEALDIAVARIDALEDMLRRVLASGLIDRKGYTWPQDQALLRDATAMVAK